MVVYLGAGRVWYGSDVDAGGVGELVAVGGTIVADAAHPDVAGGALPAGAGRPQVMQNLTPGAIGAPHWGHGSMSLHPR